MPAHGVQFSYTQEHFTTKFPGQPCWVNYEQLENTAEYILFSTNLDVSGSINLVTFDSISERRACYDDYES